MAYYCFLVASEFASSFAFFVQLQSRVAFYACLMKHNLGREGDPGWECPWLEDPGLWDPGLVNPGWEDPGLRKCWVFAQRVTYAEESLIP